ncbi:unnamed protein product, partial [Rotaria magnacalcarata]
GQQIVQLSTPTKNQTTQQNGTVIMMVPGNSGQLQAVQMQTTSASAQQTQTTVASEPTEE